jgi:hypothetical protein
MKKGRVVWYIEPIGEFTNRSIAQALEGQDARNIVCSDGKSHILWECPFHFLKAIIESSRTNKNYRFNIFRQRNNYRPQKVDFLKR